MTEGAYENSELLPQICIFNDHLNFKIFHPRNIIPWTRGSSVYHLSKGDSLHSLTESSNGT